MNRKIPEYADIMTVSEWLDSKHFFLPMDGHGYWVRNGEYLFEFKPFSTDDLWGTIPEGATHVAWFNK